MIVNKTIIINNQAELDAISECSDATIKVFAKNIVIKRRDIEIHLCDDSTAVIFDCGKVFLFDNSKAKLYDNSEAILFNNSEAILFDYSSAQLYNDSTARLCDNSNATAYDNSNIILYDLSKVTLFDNSTVIDRSSLSAFYPIVMKITNKTKGVKRNAAGDYVYEGDLISSENIEIEVNDRFICEGSIISDKSIISKKAIIALGDIKSGKGIRSGDDIIAKSIVSAGFIKSGWDIRAESGSIIGKGIDAVNYIYAQMNIISENGIMTINSGIYSECGSIRAGIGITSGENIVAAEEIEAKSRIIAGANAYDFIDEFDNRVICKKLSGGQIAYGELKIKQ